LKKSVRIPEYFTSGEGFLVVHDLIHKHAEIILSWTFILLKYFCWTK